MPKTTHHEHKLKGKSLSDQSFLQSLASIHLDSSQKTRQSRRSSIDGHCNGGPKNHATPQSRRVTMCGPAPDLCRKGGEDFPLTPPCQVQSILKSHMDAPDCRPSGHRVSFHNHSTPLKMPPLPFPNQKPSNSRSSHVSVPSSRFVCKRNDDVRAVSPTTVSTSFPMACYQQTNHRCSQRSDYTLGETARSSSHMIIETCPQVALQNVSLLKNYEFAFVKRSDRSWTYSILARRSQDSSDDEESMMFLLNKEGETKVVEKEKWARNIRCLAVDDSQVNVE